MRGRTTGVEGEVERGSGGESGSGREGGELWYGMARVTVRVRVE